MDRNPIFPPSSFCPNSSKGLRYTPKQDVIYYLLVGAGKAVKLMGKGKYIMEVVYRKEFFLTFFHPS